MMEMLYRVDLFLSEPTRPGISGYDPKEACRHVSELFHMYQAELLSKRELLAEFTCEDITADEFVQQGKKQEVDDLADMFASFS
ncbi:uncharacterized protein PSFLO_03334 [Pseudozyma flocculosa]|uniref:Uncharacterized protein n=1 Tax=Pseudozyma flocculosa TaxID=84751 RepID=A0A5C3F2A2_9BASI|nr:uncharacterized protein PSFLO_03334 [Pseudozyma flocculosa]